MIVATFAFPDERTPGIAHLHAGFADLEGANIWIQYLLDVFGPLPYQFAQVEGDWGCNECRRIVRDRWKDNHRWFKNTWNGEL
jgi:hypothetical protein